MAKKGEPIRFTRKENVAKGTVTWTDKAPVADRPSSVTVCLFDLPAKIKERVALYGLAKLEEDRTSSVDPDEKLEARLAVHQMLTQGTWAKAVVRGAPIVAPEVEALAALKGVSVAAIQKKRKSISAEMWAQIIAHPTVKSKAEEIRVLRELESDDLDLDAFLLEEEEPETEPETEAEPEEDEDESEDEDS